MGGSHERSGRFLRPEAREPDNTLSAPSVLVAEDGPDLQWRLARTLTIEGCRVVGTSSPEGAVALLEQWSVDIAIISERIWNDLGSSLVAERLRRLCLGLPLVLIANANRKANEAAIGRQTTAQTPYFPVFLHPPIKPENVRTAMERAFERAACASSLLTSTPAG